MSGIKVAVLDDGDNTTWCGDAIMVTLSQDEYAGLTDGDSKLLRNKDGPSFQTCISLLENICGISRMRGEFGNDILMEQVKKVADTFKKVCRGD